MTQLHSQAWWEANLPHIKASIVILHHFAGWLNNMQALNDLHLAAGDAGVGYQKILGFPDDPTTVHQGRPDDVMAAAAHGANRVSINIAVNGDYSHRLPDAPVLEALENLMLIECIRLDITADLVDDHVLGHRDVYPQISHDPDDATECPGDCLYEELTREGGIKDRLKDKLRKRAEQAG